MANQLYASVTGCSNIVSAQVSDSYNAATSMATIQCLNSSVDVGDHITVRLGYSSNHDRVFAGYVKSVQRSQSPTVYEITAANVLIRAVDYFMASTNPETPFSRENISAQALIGDLLAEAGITSYSAGSPGFTFATNGEPLEINLVSVYDFCKLVTDITAWHLYADNDGTVHFVNRPPFPNGDSSVATLSNSNLLSASYFRSDRDLRNRVVVYGSEGVYAEAKASSPYLPAGFYKTVAVAAPNLITSNSVAQAAANYNLAKLNRLTIGGSATLIGDPSISCRSCVTVNKSDIGMTGQFFVYGCEHDWGAEGYKTVLELRQ